MKSAGPQGRTNACARLFARSPPAATVRLRVASGAPEIAKRARLET
ncbi:hypothetical protein [Polyangium sp. 6x1]|nr:hypothetical protein [Polyangium sp. 6x1]MDI1451848.1 hypothetical protein [Polyangium sp. 6x1]